MPFNYQGIFFANRSVNGVVMREYQCFARDSNGMLCIKGIGGIMPAIEEAIHQIAPKSGDPFAFEFNDVYVTVTRSSDPELILRDWYLANHKKIPNNVGPYPKPVLTRKMQREYNAILRWLKSR